ncbi:MAG: hypothetical protein ACT4PJ_16400 [Gemmatimonadaceae bacterium]
MERGFDQLFIVVLILLAALFDLFARWLKRKTAATQPAPVEDDLVLVEEDDEIAWLERERAEPLRQLPLSLPPSVQAPPAFKAPAAAARRGAAERRAPPVGSPPRRRRRGWLETPADARRGIVVMTILGPCRGLKASDEGSA